MPRVVHTDDKQAKKPASSAQKKPKQTQEKRVGKPSAVGGKQPKAAAPVAGRRRKVLSAAQQRLAETPMAGLSVRMLHIVGRNNLVFSFRGNALDTLRTLMDQSLSRVIEAALVIKGNQGSTIRPVDLRRGYEHVMSRRVTFMGEGEEDSRATRRRALQSYRPRRLRRRGAAKDDEAEDDADDADDDDDAVSDDDDAVSDDDDDDAVSDDEDDDASDDDEDADE